MATPCFRARVRTSSARALVKFTASTCVTPAYFRSALPTGHAMSSTTENPCAAATASTSSSERSGKMAETKPSFMETIMAKSLQEGSRGFKSFGEASIMSGWNKLMVSSGSTKHYLNSVAKLPLAPTLVTELLALFRDPDKDVSRVVELISYEPSLTVEILRNCNSAYFAGGEPPSDIFEAVARMGFYEVYCLVVAMFGATARSMQGADKGVDIHGLWRHSVAVAVSASVIAERAGESKAVAFTAGLLHDMGKLITASVERERYAELFETAKMQGIVFNRAEQSALETNHAELGGELMHRWNLPLEIVAAVRYHHDLESAPSYGRLTAC